MEISSVVRTRGSDESPLSSGYGLGKFLQWLHKVVLPVELPSPFRAGQFATLFQNAASVLDDVRNGSSDIRSKLLRSFRSMPCGRERCSLTLENGVHSEANQRYMMLIAADARLPAGQIPPALGGLTALTFLSLHTNQLSGELAAAMPV